MTILDELQLYPISDSNWTKLHNTNKLYKLYELPNYTPYSIVIYIYFLLHIYSFYY